MSSCMYQPIDPWASTIRLLRLFQGRRHDNDRVCGELFEAQLPDKRDDTYEALSYTWGDPTRTKTITVNGQAVAITINLYDALLYLMDPEKDRILWVDALCINQQDASERTHQVAKMSVIYQKAWAVIIWLGKTTTDIELLSEVTIALDKIVRQRPRLSSNAEHLKACIDEGRRFISEMRIIDPEFYKIGERALKELLSRSWFRRVWVVQEAANAKTAYIQCSWISVPTRIFCIMPHLLDIDLDVRSQALLEVMPGPLRQSSWWNENRGLDIILQKFSTCESTDPRDQIFALLGLSTDCAQDGQRLLPNYELTMPQCIQQTVFFLVFREILVSDMFCLPAWNLEEFRHKLPSLKQALLEWGIEQKENGICIVRKLLHEAPCLDAHHAKAALNFAAGHGRADVIHSLLVRNNAKTMYSPRDIRHALECAIRANRSDLFEAIFLPLCNFNRGVSQWQKISLLEYAINQESTSAIRILVRDGSHAFAMHDPEPLSTAVHRGDMEISRKLMDVLSIAVCRGDVETSRMLMDILGVKIPAKIVPLCIRSWIRGVSPSQEKMAETLEFLTNRGADLNAKIDHPDHPTGLFQAISVNNISMVEDLLRFGAELDIKNSEGDTALIYAAMMGLYTVVDLLVTCGASLVEEGSYGRNALWTAVNYGQSEVVWLLEKHGADFGISEDTALGLRSVVYGTGDIRLKTRRYLQSRGIDFRAWECAWDNRRMEQLLQKYERLLAED